MKRSLFILFVVLSGCASQKETQKPEQASVADAGTSKLQEAAELGRVAADYPPRANQCPPPTRMGDTVFENFGQKIPDPYAWLEDEKSPEVQQWMAAQDKCARNALAHMPNREVLAKRFKQLFYVDSVSAPIKRGTRYFYVRTHADKEKPIVYWREGEKGQEKVLLDPNKWSAEGTISLGEWVPSWDGKKVAFTQKPNAADEATLYVLDVDSNKQSDVDVIAGAKYASPDWLPDNSGFYYEFLPTDPNIPVAERPGYTELRLHKLGTDPKTDALIHEKTGDPSTFLEGSLSRDGKYLFVYVIRGWSENDVYLQRVGKQKDFTLLVKGKDAQYGVAAWKDNFYIVTDEGAPKQHVFKVSAAKPERKNWKEIVKEDKDATLDGVNIVGGQLALSYLKDASSDLRLATLDGKPVRSVQLPLPIGTASNLIGNEDEDEAFYSFSSFTLPKQVYRTSIGKGGAELWAKVELPIDPAPYTVTLVRYPSKDNTQIPMFLIHRKDVQKNGQNPTLLYGYGGFNVSMQPYFKASIYPWLEAGGIYAIALLRGGGEYGKAWHDAGMRDKKQNVFDDFAAAAQYLVKENYTKSSLLGINGGSNGGLLVGAAMVQHPELYGAVVCQVPLLDMVRYTKFGSGKTWIPEYGNPEVEADYKFLSAYSPYQQIKAGVKYPPLLMMSADHDDRVDPMHARKFVAAIQHASPTTPALLRIEANAGHSGADQVRKSIDASADAYSFLFSQFGMHPAGYEAPPTAKSPQEGDAGEAATPH